MLLTLSLSKRMVPRHRDLEVQRRGHWQGAAGDHSQKVRSQVPGEVHTEVQGGGA
uniref:Uncharacterized protein n=1 Tax=Arundo donax TaxID=35708 RepID=A0A0A9FVT6_ARUDO